jgi:hypothetical protein
MTDEGMTDEEALILRLADLGFNDYDEFYIVSFLPNRRFITEVLERIEEQDRNIGWLRLKVQEMHRRAQKAEGRLSRTGYILEAIRGYLKAKRENAVWHVTFHLIRDAMEHARRGSGRAMWADCHWYHAEKDATKARAAKLQMAFEKLADAWQRGPTGSRDCSATQEMDAAIQEVKSILKEKTNG